MSQNSPLSFTKRQRIIKTVPQTDALSPYLDHLRALAFVRSVRMYGPPKDRTSGDYELEIRGAGARARMLVELKTSHVSPRAVEAWARTAARQDHPLLLFAPAISPQLGDRLEHLGVSFVDRAGNCYLNLGGKHVARIQGRRTTVRAASEKALRAPAYRALFALLADPPLISATVRVLAEAAGVSRQAAHDIRPRLEALGFAYSANKRFGWTPRVQSKALELFLSGYVTTLRPQLMIGRYRTQISVPQQLEEHIERALTPDDEIRWGGAAAAMRLSRYYRGDRTVVHADKLGKDFLKRIKAIPDRNGPLELLHFPGPLGQRGATQDTAHPLLVYAELIVEGHDRATEAAQLLREQWLPAEAPA